MSHFKTTDTPRQQLLGSGWKGEKPKRPRRGASRRWKDASLSILRADVGRGTERGSGGLPSNTGAIAKAGTQEPEHVEQIATTVASDSHHPDTQERGESPFAGSASVQTIAAFAGGAFHRPVSIDTQGKLLNAKMSLLLVARVASFFGTGPPRPRILQPHGWAAKLHGWLVEPYGWLVGPRRWAAEGCRWAVGPCGWAAPAGA